MQGYRSILMYARLFRRAGETRRFLITTAENNGWEVREEQDTRIIRSVRYTDWHRVERARMNFARIAQMLEMSGWTETA